MTDNVTNRLLRRLELLQARSPRQFLSDAENAQRRRDALRRLVEGHGLTLKDLARLIDQPLANNFYNLMGGRSHSLSQDTLERILVAFPAVSFEELVGWAGPGESRLAIELDPDV